MSSGQEATKTVEPTSTTLTKTTASICNCRFKVVLLGDSSVGKSSLAIRVVRNEFNPAEDITINGYVQHDSAQLRLGGSDAVVEFFIWDTAGQERFDSLAPMYYRRAHAAVVVFDITSRQTFAKAQHWINELKSQAPTNIVVALVGNKLDLHERREVPSDEARKYADENGLLFLEVSAKLDDRNVFQAFESIGQRLLQSGFDVNLDLDNIVITANDEKSILKRYCCNV